MAEEFQHATADVVDAVKPRLRGWLHAGVAPIALLAGVGLVAAASGAAAKWSSALFAAASLVMFTTSAAYHRGRWSPRTTFILKRLDHANIYLVIAASYTPFAVLALQPPESSVILSIVWTGALAGVAFRLLWHDAPRWLYTALYVVVGWVAVFVVPQLIEGAGAGPVALIVTGGVLYTLGGAVYAARRPNPAPQWFGFHELFHALTVAAWIAHYIAVLQVVS